MTALSIVLQIMALGAPAPAIAAPIAINEPPLAPHSLIAFSQRDFVSISGYPLGTTLTVEIIHDAALFPGAAPSVVTGLAPVDDPSTPDPNDGIVEINHPGGYCWVGATPDIRPGDKLRVTDETTNIADQTTVANVVARRAVQLDANTVQVQGTAQNALGQPLGIASLEHRLISPGNLFDVNGKRTLRAASVIGGQVTGSLTYDAPGSINWTATYDNLLQPDIDRALAAESSILWLGANPADGVESTHYEVGAGIAAGPAAPCTAPLEALPPPPGSELVPPSVPPSVAATLNGTPNTVTITWSASTDNVGVTSYGVYRNGQPIANVQNDDGSAPAPTSYVDFNVPPGAYDYTVDAADAVGNRSDQSAPPANAVAVSQKAIGIANEPPAGGRAILAFPSRDFISAENYGADEEVSVQVIRAGDVVASAAGVIPVDGLVEVNHPGGVCWSGVTPELRAGDIVRTIAYGPESATVPRSVDQITVANVVAQKAVQTGPGTVQVYGFAQAADGSPIPIDQLEQRMVATSRDPFDVNGKRTLRADSAGAGQGTLSYDAANNPTGTKWTATYSGLSSHDVQLALGVESRVLWLGRDPLAGIEITLFETALADPPGPSPAFCTSPIEAADLTAPSAPALSATPDGAARTVQLSWAASTDNWSVSGYLVSRDGQPLRYVAGDALSYVDAGVAPGPHTYTVQAFDSASPRGAGPTIIEQLQVGQGQRYGNLSPSSNTTSVTMPDVTAPSVPADLTVLAGIGQAALTWQASTDDVGVTGYNVFRDNVFVTAVSGTTYTDAGLASATYRYEVSAVDAVGNESARTPGVTGHVTGASDTTAPSVPAGVTASVPNVRARNIALSWDASTDDVGVTGYNIFRNGTRIATVNGSTLSYAENSRPAGTYSYTISALDSAGNQSAQSAAAVAAVANDPPLAPHSIIPFPARDFVSADGYSGAGAVVISVLRGGVEVYRSDPIAPSGATGLAEVNHPGGQCWAVATPDIRPGDIVRATDAAGVPDQTVVVGVTVERPIQISANTVIVRGVAVSETGARLPIDQLESRLIVGTANAFDKNGRRLLRADSAGSGDGALSYDSSTSTSWTATYTGLSAADVSKALSSESRVLWLGRAPLAGNETTIFENGPGTDGGPSAGFCDGDAGSIANAPAEPNRPVASWTPASLSFGDQAAVPASTSVARTVRLNNVSPVAMSIGKVYLAGANPIDFAIASGCGATLAAGASCTVSVTFSPTALGTRAASLNFVDDAANTTFQSVPISGVGVESAAPIAPGVPAQALQVGSTATAASIPVQVSWAASASPATRAADIAPLQYELQQSVNNGAFTAVALPAPDATSVALGLAPGVSYRYQVRACYATSCSAWSVGASAALAAAQESVKDISYSGTWTNQVVAGSFGGAVRFNAGTVVAKDKAQYRFTGTSVAWVSARGPNRGRATVSIDGGPAVTVDLYAPVAQPAQVVFVSGNLAAGRTHQIVVLVSGARTAPSTGNRVDVDGFITRN